MTNEINKIIEFIITAFIHIWPYLLITIPLSVFVNMSGISKHINRIFTNSPFVSIFFAVIVGAFSPFCSCGVIPIIASLLLSGVPLAPVMAFWIASPSMDPEMFFLSVSMLGWELAVWRLVSTIILSLSAGIITHLLWKKGFLGTSYVKIGVNEAPLMGFDTIKKLTGKMKSAFNDNIKNIFSNKKPVPAPVFNTTNYTPIENNAHSSCGCSQKTIITGGQIGCCGGTDTDKKIENLPIIIEPAPRPAEKISTKKSFKERLLKETIKSSAMVAKFMLLAFFLEALIVLYIPQQLIISTMGDNSFFSVLFGALIGVPVYTSNLAALPMIGGLLQQGMSAGAALAFLISGPITTIPAMAAVKGLTTKKVFYLYVSFAFLGALFFGYLFYFIKMIV